MRRWSSLVVFRITCIAMKSSRIGRSLLCFFLTWSGSNVYQIQMNFMVIAPSRLRFTGQLSTILWSNWSCCLLISGGMVIRSFSVSILRGPSLVIIFSTSTDAPSISQPLCRAVMPITVRTQVPRAVAIRSVGEKASPLPSWSIGASVVRRSPEGTWLASQRRFPMYEQLILVIWRRSELIVMEWLCGSGFLSFS